MLPSPVGIAGKLGNGDVVLGPLVTVCDLEALRGRVTGVGLGGGEGRAEVSAGLSFGRLAAPVGFSSSVVSVTGACFGVVKAGALDGTFFGAGRV